MNDVPELRAGGKPTPLRLPRMSPEYPKPILSAAEEEREAMWLRVLSSPPRLSEEEALAERVRLRPMPRQGRR